MPKKTNLYLQILDAAQFKNGESLTSAEYEARRVKFNNQLGKFMRQFDQIPDFINAESLNEIAEQDFSSILTLLRFSKPTVAKQIFQHLISDAKKWSEVKSRKAANVQLLEDYFKKDIKYDTTIFHSLYHYGKEVKRLESYFESKKGIFEDDLLNERKELLVPIQEISRRITSNLSLKSVTTGLREIDFMMAKHKILLDTHHRSIGGLKKWFLREDVTVTKHLKSMKKQLLKLQADLRKQHSLEQVEQLKNALKAKHEAQIKKVDRAAEETFYKLYPTQQKNPTLFSQAKGGRRSLQISRLSKKKTRSL